MKGVFRALLVGATFHLGATWAAETPMTYPEGIVYGNAVLPAMGTFLLIRKADAICAIQFEGLWRGNDSGPGTLFHSGDESFGARYTWHLGVKRHDGWTFPSEGAVGRAELTQGRLVGLGRLAIETGDNRIRCGSIELKWTAPAHVYFYRGPASEQGIEMAPTRWTRFEDVNPNDPALEWYQYAPDRPERRLAP